MAGVRETEGVQGEGDVWTDRADPLGGQGMTRACGSGVGSVFLRCLSRR